MRYIRFDSGREPRSSNPFVQALGLVVGIAFFIGAVVLGSLVLAALVGFLLIGGLIIYVRLWWLTRKAARRQEESFVDVEYRVIDTPDDDRR